MNNIQQNPKKVIYISKKKSFVILIIILLIIFFIANLRSGNIGLSSRNSITSSDIAMVSFDDNPSTISDTREFNKINYSATIKTRDVSDTLREAKGIIRDFEARIDSENINEKYGRINFVIAKSDYEDFRDEIETITHKKLFIESTSSQNLLSQKQNLEERALQGTQTLEQMQAEQKKLSTQHTASVAKIQSDLQSTGRQLATVRATIATTDNDSDQLLSLRNQETVLVQREIQLKQNLNTENTTYSTTNQNLQNLINGAKGNLQQVATEDQKFTENIETVNASLSAEWVSLWNIAKIFSPIHPGVVIAIVVILLWYFLTRKNYLPVVKFV